MGKKIFHLVKLKDAKPCHVGQIKKGGTLVLFFN